MCGIAAIYAYGRSAISVNAGELMRMREAMAARGPDGAGLWVDPTAKIGLAHRRLSILDLSEAAAQPMTTPDGRLRITFNGEIYNYRELRGRLQGHGHVFRTESDTEVLLYAYLQYGRALVEQLRGMFAFALWDEEKKGLLLARDHFGIKPLYYLDDGRSFRCASQVKALVAGGGATLSPEPAGHVGFFVWGCVPEPYTLYRNVLSLPAGHTLWLDPSGAVGPTKYFDIANELKIAGESSVDNNATDTLRVALRNSVQHHLIADVPVGVFLSAGLDSATIAAVASESTRNIEAVTIGFDEYEGTPNDEVPLARDVALRYGCNHRVSRVTANDFHDELPAILRAMDQPSIDGVNTYFVAREAARTGLKVALSGLGGDELLGGYPSFRHVPAMVKALGVFSKLPGIGRLFRLVSAPAIRRLTSPKYASLLEYGGSYGGAYLLRRGLYMPWELPEFLDADLVREGWERLQPVMRLDAAVADVRDSHAKVAIMEMTVYMRNMLLRDSDWAGMAHSLEIRVPFVDVPLLRALAPYVAKPGAHPAKQHLRDVPRTHLPDQVVNRRKTGFSVPFNDWLDRTADSSVRRGLRAWSLQVNSPLRACS